MKIYISTDIEGIAGICSGKETGREKGEYNFFQKEMTKEVAAACEGAIEAGAKEIVVRDAHGTARNILFEELPESVKIIRSWTGHPYMMMDSLDGTFDAVMFVGYHSGTGSDGNALSHTMTSTVRTKINGVYMTEFDINSMIASYEKVPVTFLSGDDTICEVAKKAIKNIKTVSAIKGLGAGVISKHPNIVRKEIKTKVKESLKNIKTTKLYSLPKEFNIEFTFTRAHEAYARSFFPGMKMLAPTVLQYSSKNFYEALIALHYTLGIHFETNY